MTPPTDRDRTPRATRARWRWSRQLAFAAGLLWLVGAWHVSIAPIAALARIDLALADLRQSLALPPVQGPRDDIVIVDIDDASLRELGRWPWPRDRLAALVSTLFDDDHVAVLGIDLLLTEPDEQARAVRDTLQSLGALAPADLALHAALARWQGALELRADHDAQLARALAGHPVTLAYHFNHQADPHAAAAALPPPLADPAVLPASALAPRPWQGLAVPVPILMRSVAAVGFINELPDADGELRSTLLVTSHGDAVYEAFALSLWRQWRGLQAPRPLIAPGKSGVGRLTALQLSDANGEPLRALRVDERGAVAVPYRRALLADGSPGSGRFRYLSAADVLSHRIGARELQGRAVLLGSSAPGLADLRATPIHRALPGIEVHAQLLAGLEDDDLGVRPDWSPGLELLVLALVLAGVTLAVRRLNGPAALLALAGIAALVLLGDLLAFGARSWAIPMAAPLVGGGILGVCGVIANYLLEWRARRALARLFGHYLPPERVRAMARDPERFLDVASSAENRELTVLFCDLRGFTPMAEHLAPERLRELLNLYFSRMSERVHAHGGTLDKFIGDAVMAFWGAPQPDALHAQHAVRAALAMMEAVAPLNAELAARGLPPLAPCIGMATGVVCVGDLGSARRRSYTAVGDGVNLAARIEALTRSYGLALLVADTTREAAGELPGHVWITVDRVAVKGRSQRATLYAPLALPAPQLGADDAENAAFHEQLGLWRLAQEALGGHHDDSSPASLDPLALATATARLTELLAIHPASAPLHSLANHRLAALAATRNAAQNSNPDNPASHPA